mmetsp:Transcript_11711/g.17052  ORF Transcript_11711/g.17052 Transcript_11711/m.17052 type:complete len:168 (+) Transcript_11711:52-555(+)
MSLNDDSETDDFFGDQGDDCDEYVSNDFIGVDDANNVNPQQGDSSRVTEGLAFHETRASEETFHNMGYHDGFDEAKELHLQKGFEEGYREVFDAAMRVGKMFGEVSTRAILETVPVSETATIGDCQQEHANAAALMVKTFLNEQVANETGEIKDLEATLQSMLRLKE